jgi:hypothetical protein
MIDYNMEIAFRGYFQDELAAIPLSNRHLLSLVNFLNDPVSLERLRRITSDTWLHKLSFKMNLQTRVGADLTTYGHLLKEASAVSF